MTYRIFFKNKKGLENKMLIEASSATEAIVLAMENDQFIKANASCITRVLYEATL